VQRGTGKLAVAVEPQPVDSDWPSAQCCRPCRLVIVPPYGGVADIGLSSYSPVRRRAATIVSDLKTSTSRSRAFNLGPQGA
jgi:hypothetical protein